MKKSIPNEAFKWLELLLQERFGHSFTLRDHAQGLSSISWSNDDRSITLAADPDTFTRTDSDLPCTQWNANAEGWHTALPGKLPAPGAAQLPARLIAATVRGWHIGYDILGLAYWMLTRQEEVGRSDLDNHGRFPSTASHAYKHDYLVRPIVDEWLQVLGQVIQRQWPSCRLKMHEFHVKVSHDVDQPSLYAFTPWRTIVRMMAGHLLKRRDLRAFVQAPYVKLATRSELLEADPYNTFDWVMDVSDQNNMQSAFYFLCGRTNAIYDADYELEHPAIRKLMRRIHERGHEIGLHPSYDTYQNPHALKLEAEKLKRVCGEEGIEQAQWGGRMHYLRWKQPDTPRAWEQAGLDYDSSLGYADRPGFRCGTCFEYPGFDPVSGEGLQLRVRPLVMMESSLLDSTYLGLGASHEATAMALALKDACRRVRGEFSLLWHNSTFFLPEHRKMYVEILKSP